MQRIRKYLRFGLKWQLRNHADNALRKVGLVRTSCVTSAQFVAALPMTDSDIAWTRRQIGTDRQAVPGITAARDAMLTGLDEVEEHNDAYDRWLDSQHRL